MNKKLEQIAKTFLRIETLETRMSDDLDFHDCHVGCIKDALEAAYEAGYAKGWDDIRGLDCNHLELP